LICKSENFAGVSEPKKSLPGSIGETALSEIILGGKNE
jgi:hypothetical protein